MELLPTERKITSIQILQSLEYVRPSHEPLFQSQASGNLPQLPPQPSYAMQP